MVVNNARFVLSAPGLDECPVSDLPEVCFAGRSNVGKSSIINALTNRKKLAKTSNTPGKTQTLNYFLINDLWHLVDMPGYGFAQVPKAEKKRWEREINRYFKNRKNLRLVVSLVDARRGITELDEQFIFGLAENELPFIVVLTKSDKLSKSHCLNIYTQTQRILEEMNIEVPLLLTSAENGTGISELNEQILDFVNDQYEVLH